MQEFIRSLNDNHVRYLDLESAKVQVAGRALIMIEKVHMQAVNDDLLQEATRRLVELFHPEQIILFGSQAWGTPTSDSDMDLMVIVTQSDLSDYERALLGHRCLGGLDIAKDVIVKTRAEFDFFRNVRASLEHRIAHQGKVLYDRRQGATRPELAHQSAA